MSAQGSRAGFALRAYRWIVRTLPVEFRREFGEEMVDVVDTHWTAVRRGLGPWGAARFWALEFWAVARIAIGFRFGWARGAGWRGPAERVVRAARRAEGGGVGGLWQDTRYAVRSFSKQPGFTVTTVLTLGLGVGASTAVFSAVHAVLFRALPYEEPDRIVVVFHRDRESGQRGNGLSPSNARDLAERTRMLSEVAVAEPWGADIQLDGRAESLRAWRVSRGFFEALGVEPVRGRLFTSQEYEAGQDPVIVLGHGSWQSRFAGELQIPGSTVILDGETVTVVGVLPPDFKLPDEAEFWTPRPREPFDDRQRSADYMMGIARLADGATIQGARDELEMVAAELGALYPGTNATRDFAVVPLREHLVGNVRTPLLVLLGAVGFVLLIACANVAGLMLARGVRRQREYALRRALGATRGRLARQLTVESFVLASLGCLLGVVFAVAGVALIQRLGLDHLPRIDELRIDGAALTFAVGAAAVSALLAGMAPSLRSVIGGRRAALGEGGRGATWSPTSSRSGRRLVIAEVAAAMVLVVGAGLLAKSFITLLDRELGFEPEDRLALQAFAYQFEEPGALDAFIRGVETRMEAIPGADGVAITSSVPGATDGVLAAIDITLPFSIEDRAGAPIGQEPTAAISQVSHDLFDVMGMRIVEGRGFLPMDDSDAPQVVVINETLARRYFGSDGAVGRKLVIGYRPVPREIVGIVADVRPGGYESEPRPEVYFPLPQSETASLTFVLRTEVAAGSLAAAARQAVWDEDPTQAIWGVATVESLLGDWLKQRRFNLLLLGAFGAVALTLAAIGLYGLISFGVEQRVAELGIRRVLGGDGTSILTLVLAEGVKLAGAGILLGLLAAVGFGRSLRGMLYGVEPTDPRTLAWVAGTVLAVAMLASLIPALRAVRADPIAALREH